MKVHKEYNDYEIIIIIGGYYNTNYKITKEHNIKTILCNHNSIDYTGLITLLELYPDANEYYLYLHDTCFVGELFYKKIKAIELNNVSSIKINKIYSMNIGIYSQEIINKSKTFLLSKKNTDENKLMEFKMNGDEDYIFNNDPNNIVLENYNDFIRYGPVDYYKTGTMRIIEHYPNLDLYKIKANYKGEFTVWTLDL
jgi:hypothetical protein